MDGTGDGASENRSTFKRLATISARWFFQEFFGDDELAGLPLDFKIAFDHPCPIYKDKVKIVIGGEMPHWVKKFRNAMDNKSRDLQFRGKKINLPMIYDVWQKRVGMQTPWLASVNTEKRMITLS